MIQDVEHLWTKSGEGNKELLIYLRREMASTILDNMLLLVKEKKPQHVFIRDKKIMYE